MKIKHKKIFLRKRLRKKYKFHLNCYESIFCIPCLKWLKLQRFRIFDNKKYRDRLIELRQKKDASSEFILNLIQENIAEPEPEKIENKTAKQVSLF